MKGLEGKRVLVTGGASGIGAATVVRFLEEGSRVCVIDRDAEANERFKHEHPKVTANFSPTAFGTTYTLEHPMNQGIAQL